MTKEFTGRPAKVRGNNGKLHQAVLNLLANAIDAISEVGQISIETKFIKDELTITIGDNGCGIRPENLNKVMDPFYTTTPPPHWRRNGIRIIHNPFHHSGTRWQPHDYIRIG
ncbi:MAG: ATP-binding protein [bacterium]|nr:ATP-binding protein [bacterium]